MQGLSRGFVGALPRVERAREVDEDRLAGLDVAQHAEAERLDRHRLGGDHVLGAAELLVAADDQRPDAERVAEREQAVAGDHRDDRVGAAAAPVHAGHRAEDRVGIEPVVLRGALELEREHVEQHLAVAVGVDVAEVELEELALSARSLLVRLPLWPSVMPNGEFT